MRITSEHIGKKVHNTFFSDNEIIEVTAVYVDKFSGIGDEGQQYECYFNRTPVKGDWELVEEPKKPSARISELMSLLCGLSYTEAMLSGILRYLDEQAEKGK